MLSNALWAEMAAFVAALPEADKLGSYLLLSLQVGKGSRGRGLACMRWDPKQALLPAHVIPILNDTTPSPHPQVANVVPAAVMLRGPEAMHLESVIWILLLGGILTSQLMSFCWSSTTDMSNGNMEDSNSSHSIALIILTFFAGSINNSSSLYLYPFVAQWESRYISALATGEGLSGILVSLLALAQNVGGRHPRFSVTAFFQGVSAFYLFSVLGFSYLLREQKRQEARKMTSKATAPRAAATVAEETRHASDVSAYKRLLLHQSTTHEENEESTLVLPLSSPSFSFSPSVPKEKPVLHLIYPLLLAQFGISAWAYGVIPALTPISTGGYQHSGKILQFSSFVSMALDPLSRALTHYCRCYRLLLLFGIVNLLAILLAVAAGMAPRPPFWEWEGGGVFVVVVNGGFTAAFAFCSTMFYFSIRLALQLRSEQEEENGKEGRESGAGGGVMGVQAAAAFETCAMKEGEETEEGEQGNEVGSDRGDFGVPASTEEGGRDEGREDEEKQQFERGQLLRWQEGFRWSSFVIQIGAFVGALLTFLLVR